MLKGAKERQKEDNTSIVVRLWGRADMEGSLHGWFGIGKFLSELVTRVSLADGRVKGARYVMEWGHDLT